MSTPDTSEKIKKTILFTLASIGLMAIGAGTTFAVSKMVNTPSALQTSTPNLSPTTKTISPPIPTIPTKQVVTQTVDSKPAPTVTAPATTNQSNSPVNNTNQQPVQADDPVVMQVATSAPVKPHPEYVMAEIINVKPLYDTQSVPYQKCKVVPRVVYMQYQHAVDGSGAVLGGVTGGLVGNQIAHGHGRLAAAIGGTILGAFMGNQVEQQINRPVARYVYVTVCKTHYYDKSVLTGYNVTYQYDGKTVTKFMKKRPDSDHIRLELTPV